MTVASYASLAQVQIEVKATTLDTTKTPVIESNNYLTNEALPQAAERIDEYCGTTFMPRIETRSFDASKDTIDWYHNQLMLDQPLLSASAFVSGNVSLVAWDGTFANRSAADYTTYPYGQTPAYALQNFNTDWLNNYNDNTVASWMSAFQVTGIWGYRQRYSTEGWIATGDSVQDALGINASVTSITVTSVNGALPSGFTPRFSPCQLLQIGTEFLEVGAVNASTNVLSVTRGARGSTAAPHAKDTPISLFVPDPVITRAAIRFAAYQLQRRTVYEQVTVAAQNTVSVVFPTDLSDEVRNILRQRIWYKGGRV